MRRSTGSRRCLRTADRRLSRLRLLNVSHALHDIDVGYGCTCPYCRIQPLSSQPPSPAYRWITNVDYVGSSASVKRCEQRRARVEGDRALEAPSRLGDFAELCFEARRRRARAASPLDPRASPAGSRFAPPRVRRAARAPAPAGATGPAPTIGRAAPRGPRRARPRGRLWLRRTGFHGCVSGSDTGSPVRRRRRSRPRQLQLAPASLSFWTSSVSA